MQRGLPWSDGPQQHPDTPPPSPAASRRRLREIAWREAEQRTGSQGTLVKDPKTGEYHLLKD